MSAEATPIPPHLASEFYLWLWWTSERDGSRFALPDPVGPIDAWVVDRLAFRNPADTKVTALMTGENAPATPEARAALAGGKVLQDVKIGLRRDDREFELTLKGPAVHVSGLKLPAAGGGEGEAGAMLERFFLYEEAVFLLRGLFQAFARERTGPGWRASVEPALRAWLGGAGEG